MNPDATPATVVLGDVLAAAADDLAIPLDAHDVRRLAQHVLERLSLLGYELTATEDRDARRM